MRKFLLVVITLFLANAITAGAEADELHDAALLYWHDSAKLRSLLDKGANVNARDNDGETPLHQAASSDGNLGAAKLLISKGAYVNARDTDGETPLHEAATTNYNYNMAEFLISQGADINASDRFGRTPLHVAARPYDDNPDVARLLISKGAYVNARDRNGETPLHYAAQPYQDKGGVAEFLLSKGADVNARDKNGQTPLYKAVREGNRNVAEFLIAKGADINARTPEGWTPLQSAAYNNRRDVAELLISKGADVNARDKTGTTPSEEAEKSGNTEIVTFLKIALKKQAEKAPYKQEVIDSLKRGLQGTAHKLHSAVFAYDIAKVRSLLDEGADVNARETNGWTPLHIAIHDPDGSLDVVGLLIAKGADINARNADGSTPLHSVAYNNRRDVAELLISKGADVNARDKDGWVPLHSAALFGNRDVAEILITKGADVNARARTGWTPLYIAAYEGKRDMAEFLIFNGADVNAKVDSYGWTPLHRAVALGKRDVAELLISKGANINIKDSLGRTLLQIAEKEKKSEVVDLLKTALQKQEEDKKQRDQEFIGSIKPALQGTAGEKVTAFALLMEIHKGGGMTADMRELLVPLAARMNPPPAITEEARRYLIRGNALMQEAKNPEEAKQAIEEYRNALLIAPWWGDAYYNLSKAEELAKDFDKAVNSMKYYLLTEPQDKREAQDRLYTLEAKRDKAKGM